MDPMGALLDEAAGAGVGGLPAPVELAAGAVQRFLDGHHHLAGEPLKSVASKVQDSVHKGDAPVDHCDEGRRQAEGAPRE